MRAFFIRFILLIVLLTVPLIMVNAQQDAVQDALNNLNSRLGTSYTLNDINWRYKEELYTGNNLGCSYVENTSPQPESIRAYHIEFDLNFDDVYEYDYRRTLDGTVLFLCAPPPTATPLPPPTGLPTLTPTDVPTSTITPTPSGCGTTPSRLTIGEPAIVTPGDPNIIREAPGTSGAYIGEIPSGATFTVVDGPRCGSGFAWWKVDYNGKIGWTVEYIDGNYALAPLMAATAEATEVVNPATPGFQATPEPIICSPDLPPRLHAGEAGRVAPGSPNNVRRDPGAESEKVGEIPGSGQFIVLEGPVCVGDMAWWRVDYQGMVGWTPEGDDGEYWLQPPFGMLPVITVENVADLSLLNTSSGDTQGMLEKQLYDEHLLSREVNGFVLYQLFVPFDPTANVEWQQLTTVNGNFASGRFPIIRLTQLNNLITAVQTENVVQLFFNTDTEPYASLVAEMSRTATLDRNATRYAVLEADGEISVFNANYYTFHVGEFINTFDPEFGSNVDMLEYTPDGHMLLVGAGNEIKVYSDDGLVSLYTLTAENVSDITFTTFSGNSQVMAVLGKTTDGDMQIDVWNLEDEKLVRSIQAEDGLNIDTLALSPDGSVLAVGDSGEDQSHLTLYSTESGENVAGFDTDAALSQLAFNRTGTALFGLSVGQAYLWAVEK